MAASEVRSARAFLFKRGVKNISPVKFAAAAAENNLKFGELLYLLGLMADGPAAAESIQRDKMLDAEYLKISGAG